MNKCLKDNCKRQVAFVCNCTKKPVYTCSKHIGDHLMIKGEHSMMPLLITLNEEDREKTINNSLKVKKYCEDLLAKHLEETRGLINTIRLESKKYIIAVKKFKEIYTNLVTAVILGKNLDKDELENANLICFPDNYILKISSEEYKKNIKKFFSNHLPLNIENNCNIIIDDCKYAIGVIEFEDCFELCDLDTHVIESIKFPGSAVLGHYSAACRIGTEKYFMYGGWTENKVCLSTAYIIDFNLMKAEILPDGMELFLCGGTYKKNIVYVFGGCSNNNPVASCQKFNLLTKE